MTDREIIAVLQEALDKALTGGNSIASNLIGLLGANFNEYPSHEAAQVAISQRPDHIVSWINEYEQWVCWKALMEAREMVSKALQDYDGEIKPCCQR